MVKAILFDMDGVLIDSHDAWFHIFNLAYKKFENTQISVEEFDKFLWAKAFDKLAKKYFHVPVEEIRAYYEEIYNEYKERLTVMHDAKETLSSLKNSGLRLVVVSNTQRNVVERILNDVGLHEFFELFLGGDDIVHGKPEPDILLKALELLRISKEDVLFVGDTKWDRMAAKKAGIRFIGYRIDGDKKIDNLIEITEIV